MSPITVYTKPACVACKATFRALNNAGIAYLQAPVVYAGPDNHFSGFRPDQLKTLAGVAA